MPTILGTVEDNQIIFQARVTECGSSLHDAPIRNYEALLDTGAQCTMISRTVIEEVGLAWMGTGTAVGIEGNPIDTEGYRVTIHLPVPASMRLDTGETALGEFSIGVDMDVMRLPAPIGNVDILLGMDFISLHHLTIYGSNFLISY